MEDSRKKPTENTPYIYVDGSNRISVKCHGSAIHFAALRKIKGGSWNGRDQRWSFPLESHVLLKLMDIFKGRGVELDAVLEKKLKEVRDSSPGSPALEPADGIAPDIESLRHQLRLRNYSAQTIKSYESCLRTFARHVHPKHPRTATDADIRAFLLGLISNEGYGAATVNQIINALRLLYVDVYKRPMVLGEILRPKKEKKLPSVLTHKEVAEIFEKVENAKHRALLMVTYAGGLRVSEVVSLRTEDIDGERNMTRVRGGKKRRDRYTLLGNEALTALRIYWSERLPGKWLFAGKTPDKHLSRRTAEIVFERAAAKTGISKHVSIHSLRHSFAAHLLESGVELSHIQELLGHKSSKTTEIYRHLNQEKLTEIQSPLDGVMMRRGKR